VQKKIMAADPSSTMISILKRDILVPPSRQVYDK